MPRQKIVYSLKSLPPATSVLYRMVEIFFLTLSQTTTIERSLASILGFHHHRQMLPGSIDVDAGLSVILCSGLSALIIIILCQVHFWHFYLVFFSKPNAQIYPNGPAGPIPF